MNVLITGARAPICADLARALLCRGHQVWTTDSLCAPVGRFTPGIQGYLRLPAPAHGLDDFARAMGWAVRSHDIDLVIPTSEEVFWLSQIRRQLPETCKLLLPDAATLELLHHKGKFASLANRLGVGTGSNHLIEGPLDLERFMGANPDMAGWVLKQAYSRFATGVLVSPSERQLLSLRFDAGNPWLAQPKAVGPEVCLYNVVHAGKVALHLAYRPVLRAGAGASVYFEHVSDPALLELSRRIAEATDFTGQLSFDVIQTSSGPVALECNPRGTSGVHLAGQHPELLAKAIEGSPVEMPMLSPRMLALPLLMHHPLLHTKQEGRARWADASCAMRQSGVPVWGQALATCELLALSVRTRLPLLQACTHGIEWNG